LLCANAIDEHANITNVAAHPHAANPKTEIHRRFVSGLMVGSPRQASSWPALAANG
jgi:hypothetical protein